MFCFSLSAPLWYGKNFTKKLLYVQHVDKEKDTASEISDRYLEEYLIADRNIFSDSDYLTEYLKSPKANLSILKSLLEDEITDVSIYTIPLESNNAYSMNSFVVFQTWNYTKHLRKTWWSLESNGQLSSEKRLQYIKRNVRYIVLQQSFNEDDVIKKIYDTETKTSVERLGPIKKEKSDSASNFFCDLIRIIVDTNKLFERYYYYSNCHNYQTFIFEQLTGVMWTTMAIVDRLASRFSYFSIHGLKNKKIQPGIQVDAFKYKSVLNDNKFHCYKAMMGRRRKDFKKLISNFTIECLNSVDFQGYTLFEWATVFSTSDWPIDEELKKKGAVIPSNEGFFRRNVFFIALQYWPPNKKTKLFDSFDGIDINGVNETGDTALHLALYGEKWGIAVKILNQFEEYDVDVTNIRGDTPLHLATKFNCGFGLFKKILNRTNSEYVNKVDGNGCTALHYAIGKESEIKVKELLNRTDVDVNIQNNENKCTAFHFALQWEDIPVDLLNLIREKSADVNPQDEDGDTALHCVISIESGIALNELLKQKTPTSTSGSSDSVKGKKFLKKLLYVQHVNEEKNTASEISNRCLQEYLLADRNIFSDSNFTEYLQSANENLIILKRSMRDKIRKVTIYSNPLPIPLQVTDVTIHAFVVFQSENYTNGSCKKTWWSLEKNGQHIVLQQSDNKDDVINKIYDTEKKTSVERLGPIKKEKSDFIAVYDRVENVLRIIWGTNQLNNRYHLLFSNCQNFASFVFEKLTGEMWTTAVVDRLGLKKKKIQPKIKVDAFKYKTIVKDDKFDCYWAMMEGRKEVFEELANNLTIESLNDVDSQGYTLLEWATVFSSSDWPIAEELKKKGAKPAANEKLFKQNVFFIALQFWPPNKKTKLFDSYDGIDIHGVNKTGDTALHLALNGEKWGIAGKILNHIKNYDVNITNSAGDTPLLLAARLECEFGLFKKILDRTDSENVNRVDGNENTALHYAIDNKTKFKVKELLKREDVDVNITNEGNSTALQLASNWPNIPMELFQIILDKSADINAKDVHGNTALHYAIDKESETKVKKLITRRDVKVNIENNDNETALGYVSMWKDIPSDLLKLISEKSANEAKEN